MQKQKFIQKFQIILKNGKNGHKLLDQPQDYKKLGYTADQILKLVPLNIPINKNTLTGARNNKGKQFAVRAGRVY